MNPIKLLADRCSPDQFSAIMTFATWLFAALVALALFAASNAHAVDYSLSVGATHSDLPPSGIWWEKEYPNNLDHNVPSFSLRADQRLGDCGIGLGYQYIGHFQSTAMAVGSDAAYWAHTTYPLATWQGNQVNQGLFLTGRRYVGKWYVEAGPIITYTDFQMQVYDRVAFADPSGLTASSNRQPLSFSSHSWQVQAVAAVGYEVNDQVSISLSYLPTGVQQMPGLDGNYSPNVSIAYKF